MKKILLAGAIVLAAAAGASAADLPAAPVYTKAPPAPVYNWTGLYINGGFGYGMWDADTTTVNPVTGLCTAATLCGVQQRQGGRGWFGTVGGGFDYQFSDRIVVGALADVDFASIKGTVQDQGPFFAGSIKENWSWAAGARAGWLITPAILTYINGGYSQVHFQGAQMQDTFTGIATPFQTPAFTHGGWFIGGGVETQLTMFSMPGFFWRTEYRYADYSTTTLTDSAPGLGPLVVVPGVGTFANPQNSITFHPIVQTIRSELVYKFNWFGR